MIQRIKRRLRGRKPKPPIAGYDMTLLPDDTFLVSYPRSGNTWMRFLLATLRTGEAQTFQSIERIIPDPWQNTDATLLLAPQPRIIKSHKGYDPDYQRVIYMVRDPRDVAISFYYWRMKKNFFTRKDITLSLYSYLHQFAEKELAFQAWGEHTESWITHREALGERLLLLRYEDLLDDPLEALYRVEQFLGWEHTAAELQFAIEHSQPERMRQVENAPKNEQSIAFVRKAAAEQWREHFDDALRQRYQQAFGRWLNYFNYPHE